MSKNELTASLFFLVFELVVIEIIDITKMEGIGIINDITLIIISIMVWKMNR